MKNRAHRSRAERNRANAQASTGPKPEEGKSQSSQNSLKHGLYSQAVLLRCEDPIEFKEFTLGVIASLKPEDGIQFARAQTLSDTLWRLTRVRRLESTSASNRS